MITLSFVLSLVIQHKQCCYHKFFHLWNSCEEQDRLSDSDEDVDEHKEKRGKSSNKKQKKPGRKPRWSQELLNDFIDIIVSTDEYKTKLIFRNIKCQQNGEIYGRIRDEMKKRTAAREENFYFTIDQLRSKFKKCVSECKKAALTIKSGTGIKRFQEDKSYGEWFQKLYEIVKSRDSCQPEQAIEPTQFYRTQVSTCSTPTEDTSESEASSSNQSKNVFVPIKEPKRKSNRDDPICEAIKLMKTIAEKDPSRDLINFIKDDMEKSREHELKLMQMMLSCGNQQPSWGQSHGSTVGNLGFRSPPCSFNDGISLHHAQLHAFAPEGGMNQGVQNYQFRPISPASSRTTSDNPVYRSL